MKIITTILTAFAMLLPLTITQPVFADGKICVKNKGAFYANTRFRPRILTKHSDGSKTEVKSSEDSNAVGNPDTCFIIGDSEVLEDGGKKVHPVIKVTWGKRKHCASFNIDDVRDNHKERTYKVYGTSIAPHCKTISQKTHKHY